MKRGWIPLLGALLVAQILLATALSMTGRDFGAYHSKEKLLDVDTSKIDGLAIWDGEKHTITLARKEGKWVLPGNDDFPADSDRVTALVDKLTGFTKGWPVATTKDAAKRFKVTDAGFERKIQLLEGTKPLITLYLGTSPGFRKIHARVAGDDDIYAIEMGTYEAQATAASWEDKDYLKFTGDKLKQIDIGGLTLQWDGKKPTLAGLKDGETLNEAKAKNLVHTVLTLPFASVLGKERPKDLAGSPELTFQVTLKSGEVRHYDIFKSKDGKRHVLKVSTVPYYFTVSDFTFDELKGYDRKSLVKAANPKSSTNGGKSASTQGATASQKAPTPAK